MATLVTGAGLVGSFIARQLVARGEMPVVYEAAPNIEHIKTMVDISKIKLIRGDVLDFPELMRTILDNNIDRVMHTAGFLHAGVMARPHLGIKINIMGTANILEAARLTNIKRVVVCSSGTVYTGLLSKPQTKPLAEDFACNILSARPLSVYATTKLSCEFMGLNYYDLYGVDFAAVRFGGVFGPWMGAPGGVPGRLMRQLIEWPSLGKPVTIEPNLTYSGVCDFTYAGDAAKGTILACDAKSLKSRVYNITSGTWTFQELVDEARKMFPGTQIKVKEVGNWGLAQYPYLFTQPFDTTRAREELGYAPDYGLEKAMKDYGEWVRANLK